jgi:hypothetical protein
MQRLGDRACEAGGRGRSLRRTSQQSINKGAD